MRYTVTWSTVAIAQLASVWTAATDRQSVTDSSDRIEQALKDGPERKGIPWGRYYAYFDDPLAALFEIDPGDCMVRIVAVREMKP